MSDEDRRGETGNAASADLADQQALKERQARQRKRSIAIGLSLLFLAVLFYIVTLVKLGSNITDKAGS